jgi:small-conductance mechanosensitive channel
MMAETGPLSMDQIFNSIDSWFSLAPAWLVSLVEFGLALAVALVLHAMVFRYLTRRTANQNLFRRSLVKRSSRLVQLMLITLAVGLAAEVAPLTRAQTQFVQLILLFGGILIAASIVSMAMHIWITLYLRRFTQDSTDQFLARKHVTQTHILQRVASFVIWLTAAGVALMSIEGVRQYGVSLLASAGAAGIILGLALQPVLQNLVAGIQIAVTQPVRIGDSLIVENEYGTVEDIKATYVVIRLWDLRRLVIPLSYFLEKPFQNWTRESTNLLGTVMVYLDYSVPVAEMREKVRALLAAHPKWDQKVFALQVTDLKERTVEVRVLMSASDSGALFDLRCDMREAVIGLVQSTWPSALPRLRASLERDKGEVGVAGA